MREILFRGKRIDNGGWYDGGCAGDWVYGGYAFDGTNSYIVSYGVVVHECMGDAPDIYNDFSYIKVDPETIGQYTGLTDKNGKKIFEGDIVRNHIGRIYEVAFIEQYSRFALRRPGTVFGWSNPNSCEVIGNIYDNSELLEAGE